MKLKFLFVIIFSVSIAGIGQELSPFKVNRIKVIGKNKAQTEKMKKALTIFEKVMNDDNFKQELKTKKFESDCDDKEFLCKDDRFKDLTTKQILEKIWAGSETNYQPEENNTADIYWFAENRGVLGWFGNSGCKIYGYGYPNSKNIHTYTCYLDDKNTDFTEIVGHIAHEWTHKLGFAHHPDDNPKRKSTVPYTFGNLVAEHATKWIALEN